LRPKEPLTLFVARHFVVFQPLMGVEESRAINTSCLQMTLRPLGSELCKWQQTWTQRLVPEPRSFGSVDAEGQHATLANRQTAMSSRDRSSVCLSGFLRRVLIPVLSCERSPRRRLMMAPSHDRLCHSLASLPRPSATAAVFEASSLTWPCLGASI
jgi:hypothetical protein